jgi:hypothetical protein
MPRLNIRTTTEPVITVTRQACHNDKLVYIICARKPQKYRGGRSSILYIGTTKKGVRRMASSAASKAMYFLQHWGVRHLDVYVVTCKLKPGLRVWLKLERGLLLAFREMFGELPRGNRQGKNIFWNDEHVYFKYRPLRRMIESYSVPYD